MQNLRFRRIPGFYAVCRFPADSPIPGWARSGSFSSVTVTADELSIVGSEEAVPGDVTAERGWACFKIEGPFAFSLTGVLEAFLDPLAKATIPIFAVSTYDTDYVLVKQDDVASAIKALQQAGHEFLG